MTYLYHSHATSNGTWPSAPLSEQDIWLMLARQILSVVIHVRVMHVLCIHTNRSTVQASRSGLCTLTYDSWWPCKVAVVPRRALHLYEARMKFEAQQAMEDGRSLASKAMPEYLFLCAEARHIPQQEHVEERECSKRSPCAYACPRLMHTCFRRSCTLRNVS